MEPTSPPPYTAGGVRETLLILRDPACLLLVVSHHSVLQHNSPKQNTFTLKDLALPLARGTNVENTCEIFHFKELFMLKSDPQNNKGAS